MPGLVHLPSDTGGSSSRLDHALREATDYGLLALGETARQTIYERAENKYQVKREEIPEKLNLFHEALEGMLGAGAEVIERQIAKKLYSQLNLNFTERSGWTIVEYFDHAKKASGGP